MAVQSTLTNKYIKPADAQKTAKTSYESGKIGATDRGTAIVDKNSGLGKDSFLNLLVAQLKNMDPTQNQDSTAYVTQMAQFASIEQTNNLNTTMRDFSYEQMVGKGVILSDKNADGTYKYGIVKQIVKNGTTTSAFIQDADTGLWNEYPMSKIIGTIDSENEEANRQAALNSHFSAASMLASEKAQAVYVEIKTDTKHEVVDGQNNTVTTTTKTAHKCQIQKAYLDKQNNVVKVTIQYLDEKGNNVGDPKTVDYSTIAVAGKDLSDDVINETIKKNTLDEPIVTKTVDDKNSETDNSKSRTTVNTASAAYTAAVNRENETLNNMV